MRINRSEALDMFGKWFSERAILDCYFRFPDYRASLTGRISELSGEHIRVESDNSELVLMLRPEMTFAYEDARHIPEEESQHGSAIVVFFEEPVEGVPEKSIGFAELK